MGTSATHWATADRRSLVRVHTLLGSLHKAPASLNPTTEDVDDLNTYGLGIERSLEAFQQWAGVNFIEQTISDEAISGRFENPAL